MPRSGGVRTQYYTNTMNQVYGTKEITNNIGRCGGVLVESVKIEQEIVLLATKPEGTHECGCVKGEELCVIADLLGVNECYPVIQTPRNASFYGSYTRRKGRKGVNPAYY